MSHELRTPLNGIMGMTTLALDHRADRRTARVSGCRRHQCRGAPRDGRRRAGLRADRRRRGDAASRRPSICTSAWKPAATVSSGGQRQGPGAVVSRSTPRVPAAVVGDETRLRQILLNLLGNAVKFTPRAACRCARRVESGGRREVLLHVEVRDTGIGIAGRQARADLRAVRAGRRLDDPPVRRHGLGLSICARLVAAMGGRIWFESEPGAGSTLSLHGHARRGVSVTANVGRPSGADGVTRCGRCRGAGRRSPRRCAR